MNDEQQAGNAAGRLVVGTVRRPHGLDGEVSVDVATAFPQRFRPGLALLWRRGPESRHLVIAAARAHGSRWLLRFEGVHAADGARGLARGELSVAEKERFPAPEGFYYSDQVAGWRCENKDGKSLGCVEGLEASPAGPLLTIRTPEGKSALVPFVASIVVRIEDGERRIVLDPPEGLFDL